MDLFRVERVVERDEDAFRSRCLFRFYDERRVTRVPRRVNRRAFREIIVACVVSRNGVAVCCVVSWVHRGVLVVRLRMLERTALVRVIMRKAIASDLAHGATVFDVQGERRFFHGVSSYRLHTRFAARRQDVKTNSSRVGPFVRLTPGVRLPAVGGLCFIGGGDSAPFVFLGGFVRCARVARFGSVRWENVGVRKRRLFQLMSVRQWLYRRYALAAATGAECGRYVIYCRKEWERR